MCSPDNASSTPRPSLALVTALFTVTRITLAIGPVTVSECDGCHDLCADHELMLHGARWVGARCPACVARIDAEETETARENASFDRDWRDGQVAA